MISQCEEKFDEDGGLTDSHTSEKIAELLEALVDWTRMLKKAEPNKAITNHVLFQRRVKENTADQPIANVSDGMKRPGNGMKT